LKTKLRWSIGKQIYVNRLHNRNVESSPWKSKQQRFTVHSSFPKKVLLSYQISLNQFKSTRNFSKCLEWGARFVAPAWICLWWKGNRTLILKIYIDFYQVYRELWNLIDYSLTTKTVAGWMGWKYLKDWSPRNLKTKLSWSIGKQIYVNRFHEECGILSLRTILTKIRCR